MVMAAARGLLAAALVALSAVAVACGGSPPGTPSETITASVLVEPTPGDARWFRDVTAPAGTDGYELLVAATGGQVDADYFAEFRSHFVKTVMGIEPQGQEFWAVFLWNEHSGAWEPLQYGADWFSVKDGHVMAWARVEFSPDTPHLPQAVP